MTLIEALRANGSQLCEAAADALEDAKEEIARLHARTSEFKPIEGLTVTNPNANGAANIGTGWKQFTIGPKSK